MKPLRICFFNRSYYLDFGATGQLLTDLAEELIRDFECKVSVLAGPHIPRPDVVVCLIEPPAIGLAALMAHHA
jgi:hypothetical protein